MDAVAWSLNALDTPWQKPYARQKTHGASLIVIVAVSLVHSSPETFLLLQHATGVGPYQVGYSWVIGLQAEPQFF
jgi:hypothetical protein